MSSVYRQEEGASSAPGPPKRIGQESHSPNKDSLGKVHFKFPVRTAAAASGGSPNPTPAIGLASGEREDPSSCGEQQRLHRVENLLELMLAKVRYSECLQNSGLRAAALGDLNVGRHMCA